MTIAEKHRDIIRAELNIAQTILEVAVSKLAMQDTNGLFRAVRCAQFALKGIPELLSAVDASDDGRDLRAEFYDIERLREDVRENVADARRTSSNVRTDRS